VSGRGALGVQHGNPSDNCFPHLWLKLQPASYCGGHHSALFYYAAGVVITLLLSVLIAYFLDPAVEFLERFRVPRTIGALILVLLMILVLIAVGYTLWLRTSDFAADWPKYREILRSATKTVQGNINSFEGGVNDLTSSGEAAKSVVSHEDTGAGT